MAEIAPAELLEPWENPTSALALLSLALARQTVKEDSSETIAKGSVCTYEDKSEDEAEDTPVTMLESWENPTAALALLTLVMERQKEGRQRSVRSNDKADDEYVASKSLTMDSIDTGVPSSASDGEDTDASFSDDESGSSEI